MITVTERAADGLQELLALNNASPGEGVKLVPSGTGQVGMTIGVPSEDDEVIRQEGEPLLIVDNRLTGVLDGAEIEEIVRAHQQNPDATPLSAAGADSRA